MSPKSSSSSSSTSSSSDSSSDVEEKLEKLVLKEETEINILLLGETGVGKSTFINSFANYLSIKYFEDAEKKGLVKLIPAVYKIRDKDNKEHEIKLGSQKDENECLKIGESATQNVKTYVFPIWKGRVKVRLIDTPGMGDTRGVEQDEKNCENIINYIKKLEKIHAVCFLCKPTNARKTVYFDYCVYQILSHLESDAAKNIFFLFTNTRGSNYGPGDTFLTLKAIIKNVEDSTGVKIPLEKNMYCFDNEGFKFLGACEKNVQFDQSTRTTYRESWVQSAKTCWNFVNHLQKNIEPYVPSKLLDVNFAKRTLFQFCKVLVEISGIMADTKLVMQRMDENKSKHMQTISELKKEITKITDVVVQQWSQPILVCTSIPSCAEVYKISGENKIHYKNVCHYCFDLDKNNIQLFIAGSPDITKCENIDNTDRKCKKCGCDFLLHMHIDYTTSLRENLLVDDDAAHNIAIKESLLNDSKEISRDIQSQIDRSKEEYDEIKNLCMNLSRYLKEHAIVVFSLSYKSYIEYLINQKQSSGTSSVTTSIDDLRKLKDEYEVAQRAFEEYLKSPLSSTKNFNFEMEDEHFKHFFQLSQYGKKIENEYFQQKKLASIDVSVKEYIHENCYVKEHDKKRNHRTSGKNDHYNRDRPGGRSAHANIKPYDRHSNYQHPQTRGHPPGPYREYPSQPFPPNYNYTDSNHFQGHPSQSYGQHPFQSYRHPPPLLGQHPPPLLGQHPPPFGGYPQEASGNYGYNPNYMQPYAGHQQGTYQQGQQDTNSNDYIRTNYRDRRNDDNKNNRGGKKNDGNRTEEDNSDSDDSQHSSGSKKNDDNRKKGRNRRNTNQSKVDNKRNNDKRSNSRGRNYSDRNKEDNRDSDDSQHSSVSRKNDGNQNKDNNRRNDENQSIYTKRNAGNRGNYRGRRNYGARNKDDNRDSDDSQHSSVSRNNDGNRRNYDNQSNDNKRNDGNRGHFRPHTGRRNYGDRNKNDYRSGESRNSSVDRRDDVNRNKDDNRDSDDSQHSSVSKSDGNRRNNDNRGNYRGRYRGNYRGRGNYGDRNKENNKDNNSQNSFVFVGNRNDGNRGNFRGPYRGRGNHGDRNKEDNKDNGSQNSFVFLDSKNYGNQANSRGAYRGRRNDGDQSNPNGITFDSSGKKITSNQSNSGGITNVGNQSKLSGIRNDVTQSSLGGIRNNTSQSNPSGITSNLTSIRTASNQSNLSGIPSNLTSIRTASNQSNLSGIRNDVNRSSFGGIRNHTIQSNPSGIRTASNQSNPSGIRNDVNRSSFGRTQSNPSQSNPSGITSIRTPSTQSNSGSIRNYTNQGVHQGLTTYSNSSNTVTTRQVANPTNFGSVRSSNYSASTHSGNPTTFAHKKKSDNDSCNLM